MTTYFPGRGVLMLLGALSVSGCAVPVPVQVASWAIDGISYLTTQKSLTDHGISLVTQQDCALWRGVQGKNICDSYDDAGTVSVAALDTRNDTQKPSQVPENSEETTGIESLETASGDDQLPVSVSAQVLPVSETIEPPAVEPAAAEADVITVTNETPAPLVAKAPSQKTKIAPAIVVSVVAIDVAPPEQDPIAPKKEPVRVEFRAVPEQPNTEEIIPSPAIVATATAERILIPGHRTWSDNPGASLYYVIGSFQNRNNAKRLVKRHKILGPSVMASRVKGVETYRVAIGPFTRDEQRSVSRTIRKTGIRETWAISINRSEWMIASPASPKKVPVASKAPPIAETASLSINLNHNINKITDSDDNKEKNTEYNLRNEAPIDVVSDISQTSLAVETGGIAVGINRGLSLLAGIVSIAEMSPDQKWLRTPPEETQETGRILFISYDEVSRVVNLA